MKTKKILIFVIIVVLLICNAVALFFMHEQREEINDTISIMYPYAQKSVCLESNFKYNLRFVNEHISDLPIFDKNRFQKKLRDLFPDDDSHLLALRISSQFCSPCVEYCTNLILNDTTFDKTKIVYLIDALNFNNFEKDAKSLGIIDKDIYKVDEFDCPIDEIGFPYFVVLNSELSITHCYFPHKGNEVIDREYLGWFCKMYNTRFIK